MFVLTVLFVNLATGSILLRYGTKRGLALVSSDQGRLNDLGFFRLIVFVLLLVKSPQSAAASFSREV